MIRHQRGSIAQPAPQAALQPHAVSAIHKRHRHAPCPDSDFGSDLVSDLGSKLTIATNISAMRAAASSLHRAPFAAVAARGSPSTPLGAMSFVSQAKFAC